MKAFPEFLEGPCPTRSGSEARTQTLTEYRPCSTYLIQKGIIVWIGSSGPYLSGVPARFGSTSWEFLSKLWLKLARNIPMHMHISFVYAHLSVYLNVFWIRMQYHLDIFVGRKANRVGSINCPQHTPVLWRVPGKFRAKQWRRSVEALPGCGVHNCWRILEALRISKQSTIHFQYISLVEDWTVDFSKLYAWRRISQSLLAAACLVDPRRRHLCLTWPLSFCVSFVLVKLICLLCLLYIYIYLKGTSVLEATFLVAYLHLSPNWWTPLS